MPDTECHFEEGLIAFNRDWCWKHLLRHCSPSGNMKWPTRCQLTQLLAVLYHASFKTEEGRFPKLAAMWLDSDSKNRKDLNVLTFDQRKKLNEPASTMPHADFLKTASICDSETTFLLVKSREAEGLDLLAWGIADIRGRCITDGKTIREKLDISQYPRDVLTVHSTGPGRLSIRANGEFKAAYPEGGTLVGLWCLVGDFVRISRNESDGRPGTDSREADVREAIVYFVELVIGRLVASGRGGVLLWHDAGESDLLHGGTPVSEGNFFYRQIYEMAKKGSECIRPEAPYRLRNLAQLMSAIASVDGATVFARNLTLMRYGTKISTAQGGLKKVEEHCCPKTYKWLMSRGTRHVSAAHWVEKEGTRCRPVGDEKRPLALVVSADGDANAIFWKDDKICRRHIMYRQL